MVCNPNYHPNTQAVKVDYSLAGDWVAQTTLAPPSNSPPVFFTVCICNCCTVYCGTGDFHAVPLSHQWISNPKSRSYIFFSSSQFLKGTYYAFGDFLSFKHCYDVDFFFKHSQSSKTWGELMWKCSLQIKSQGFNLLWMICFVFSFLSQELMSACQTCPYMAICSLFCKGCCSLRNNLALPQKRPKIQ